MTCCLSCLLVVQDCKISNLSSLRKGYFIRLFWRRSGGDLCMMMYLSGLSRLVKFFQAEWRLGQGSIRPGDDFVGATRKLDFWPPRFSFISFSLIHISISESTFEFWQLKPRLKATLVFCTYRNKLRCFVSDKRTFFFLLCKRFELPFIKTVGNGR